jgi:ubiquinone/menaquinone biosynthesis C-methylase UbiE
MRINGRCKIEHPNRCGKSGRGGNTFWMHDADRVFCALGLVTGDVFVDAGCGPGDYSLFASGIVGESGVVYALDMNETLILGLKREADSRGITNIRPMVGDLTGRLPIEDGRVDVCLISNVLHIPAVSANVESVADEIRRVLRPEGRLAVIEVHKMDMPFGPPAHVRLSSDEVRRSLERYGFVATGLIDLGYNYLIRFVTARPRGDE